MRLSLGKGLQSLIPKKEEKEVKPIKKTPSKASWFKNRKESIFNVEIDKIVPNPHQPRQELSKDGLKELADSIREHGILQPLVVTKLERSTERGRDVEYELVAGERRWRAAKMVGLPAVPVIIRDSSAHEKLELALVENIQRENLNALDLALAYKQLQDEFKLRHEDIGKKVGKNRTTITNTLRILTLPLRIQQALALGEINEGHTRALLMARPDARMAIFRKIVKEGLSVRVAENLARQALSPESAKISGPKNPLFRRMEKDLRRVWEHRISINKRKDVGTLSIEFCSEDELDKLVNHFSKI